MDLTLAAGNKFLRPFLSMALVAMMTPSMAAQDNGAGGYQGPVVGSPGGAEVGTRGGRQVDLRFFAGVSGAYDNSLRPLVKDANGNIVPVDGLYGVEISAGAYGSHNFRRSQLGLDYHGAYRRYNESSYYNGTDQSLGLKYMYQSSRRVILTLYESAGTLVYGNNGVAASATRTPDQGLDRSAVFFDSRFNFLQSTASLTFVQSAKTSYTMSGSGFLQNRKQSVGLTNSWGYDFSGSVNRLVTRSTGIGASFTHSHFEFPLYGTIGDTNAYHGTFRSNFAPGWNFALQAGVAISEIESPFTRKIGGELAALFGVKELIVSGISFNRNFSPSGAATLQRQFQRTRITLAYSRGVLSGNGFSTVSRQESATGGVSYNGLRKVSLNVDGGYYSLNGLDQSIGKTSQYSAGVGASYNLGRATYLTLRYDYRDQEITYYNYVQQGSRVTFGLTFSPGNIPLSIW